MSVFLLVLFFILMFLGIPVAISLGISVVTSVFLFTDVPLNIVIQSMYSSMNSFIMVAVPLFILAGIIMDEGGMAKRLFSFANSCVGWMRGGLGHVNVFVSLLFAGMAGSSIADVVSTGRVTINAMTDNRYPLMYSTGLTLISSMLASVVPPSILMVVAASTASVSVGKALIGGLIPGVILAVIFMISNYFYCKKNNIAAPIKFDLKVLGKEFIKALPALLVPIVLLGGILSGLFTPTEAAGIAVLYALVVSLFIYKDISFKKLPGMFFETANMTGTILFIAVTAKAASWAFEYDGLPVRVAAYITDISPNSFFVLLLIFVFLLIVGMFMDATAAIFILVPILMPTVTSVGIDPLFFVIFMVMALSFGLVTPPVGVCLYAASSVTGLKIEAVSKSVLPWIFITIIVLLLFIVFPELITAPLEWFDI